MQRTAQGRHSILRLSPNYKTLWLYNDDDDDYDVVVDDGGDDNDDYIHSVHTVSAGCILVSFMIHSDLSITTDALEADVYDLVADN